MLGISILGSAKALPTQIVTSADLDKKLGFKVGHIEKITGLKQRHFLSNDERSSDLVIEAVTAALKDAKLSIDDIDCIINASGTMEQAIPFNAASTHRLLAPSRPIPSFDINMTCLSVLRAFDVAAHLFDAYKTILIVSCDIASIGLDWSQIRTAGIFGDGASALIVSPSKSGGIICSAFETHTKGYEHCMIRGGGSNNHPKSFEGEYKEVSNFEMQGRSLYKLSLQILPPFLKKTLKEHSLTMADIDWIVPHQASQASLNHIIKLLDIDKEKFIDIFSTHGNQVAVSIPTALHTLLKNRPLKSGQKVLLFGTSAGLGLGMVVWQVP